MISKEKLPFRFYLLETIIIIFLLLATVVINLRMIRDGLSGNADIVWHLTWLQHFSQQISEGIIYPRWLAGTNYGYGSPTFVFYPPLVYYLGSALKFTGLNVERVAVFSFSLGLFLLGFNSYIFARENWRRIPSLVTALAYMTTPHIAYIYYSHNSLSKALVFPWIPLGLWLTEKSLKEPRWRIGLASIWAIVALSHLPSLILAFPIWLVYIIFSLLRHPWKQVLGTVIYAGIGLGLASFFLLPVILEKSLVDIGSMQTIGGTVFQERMLTLDNLFPITWKSRLSYIFVHESLIIIICAVLVQIFYKNNRNLVKEAYCWLIFALTLTFFMSYLSWPIWRTSSTLQSVQTPLRLLSFFSFASAALCGLVTSGLFQTSLRRIFKVLISLIIVLILLVNFGYGYKWSRQFTTLYNPGNADTEYLDFVKTIINEPYQDNLRDVAEYRPLTSEGNSPPEPVIGEPRLSILSGEGEIKLENWGSYERSFQVIAEETSEIRIRTYHYPAWHLYVDNKQHTLEVLPDSTMSFRVGPGTHQIKLRYEWTRAFKLGMAMSVVSFLIFIWLILNNLSNRRKNHIV